MLKASRDIPKKKKKVHFEVHILCKSFFLTKIFFLEMWCYNDGKV